MPPWEELKLAEQRLDDARRAVELSEPGTTARALAEADADSAKAAVRELRRSCGALFAELFLHASRCEGVRQFVGRVLDAMGVADDFARGVCNDLGISLGRIAADNERLRADNWELARAVALLELRVERLEAVGHEQEERPGVGGHGPGAGRRAGQGHGPFRVVPAG